MGNIAISSVVGIVKPGDLRATQLRITGNVTLKNCTGRQLHAEAWTVGPLHIGSPQSQDCSRCPIGVSPSPGIPPTSANPNTGLFTIIMDLIAPVNCGSELRVQVWCAKDPKNCIQEYSVGNLDCGPCPHAQVSAKYASCDGSPKQPVTLQATIIIPARMKITYQWDYGDGTPAQPSLGISFTLDNTKGTAAKQFGPITDPGAPHGYVPGNYTAKLKVVPPPALPDECAREIPLAITASDD